MFIILLNIESKELSVVITAARHNHVTGDQWSLNVAIDTQHGTKNKQTEENTHHTLTNMHKRLPD